MMCDDESMTGGKMMDAPVVAGVKVEDAKRPMKRKAAIDDVLENAPMQTVWGTYADGGKTLRAGIESQKKLVVDVEDRLDGQDPNKVRTMLAMRLCTNDLAGIDWTRNSTPVDAHVKWTGSEKLDTLMFFAISDATCFVINDPANPRSRLKMKDLGNYTNSLRTWLKDCDLYYTNNAGALVNPTVKPKTYGELSMVDHSRKVYYHRNNDVTEAVLTHISANPTVFSIGHEAKWPKIYVQTFKVDTPSFTVSAVCKALENLKALRMSAKLYLCEFDLTRDCGATLKMKDDIDSYFNGLGAVRTERNHRDVMVWSMSEDSLYMVDNTGTVGDRCTTIMRRIGGMLYRCKYYDKFVQTIVSKNVSEGNGSHVAAWVDQPEPALRGVIMHEDTQRYGSTRLEVTCYSTSIVDVEQCRKVFDMMSVHIPNITVGASISNAMKQMSDFCGNPYTTVCDSYLGSYEIARWKDSNTNKMNSLLGDSYGKSWHGFVSALSLQTKPPPSLSLTGPSFDVVLMEYDIYSGAYDHRVPTKLVRPLGGDLFSGLLYDGKWPEYVLVKGRDKLDGGTKASNKLKISKKFHARNYRFTVVTLQRLGAYDREILQDYPTPYTPLPSAIDLDLQGADRLLKSVGFGPQPHFKFGLFCGNKVKARTLGRLDWVPVLGLAAERMTTTATKIYRVLSDSVMIPSSMKKEEASAKMQRLLQSFKWTADDEEKILRLAQKAKEGRVAKQQAKEQECTDRLYRDGSTKNLPDEKVFTVSKVDGKRFYLSCTGARGYRLPDDFPMAAGDRFFIFGYTYDKHRNKVRKFIRHNDQIEMDLAHSRPSEIAAKHKADVKSAIQASKQAKKMNSKRTFLGDIWSPDSIMDSETPTPVSEVVKPISVSAIYAGRYRKERYLCIRDTKKRKYRIDSARLLTQFADFALSNGIPDGDNIWCTLKTNYRWTAWDRSNHNRTWVDWKIEEATKGDMHEEKMKSMFDFATNTAARWNDCIDEDSEWKWTLDNLHGLWRHLSYDGEKLLGTLRQAVAANMWIQIVFSIGTTVHLCSRSKRQWDMRSQEIHSKANEVWMSEEVALLGYSNPSLHKQHMSFISGIFGPVSSDIYDIYGVGMHDGALYVQVTDNVEDRYKGWRTTTPHEKSAMLEFISTYGVGSARDIPFARIRKQSGEIRYFLQGENKMPVECVGRPVVKLVDPPVSMSPIFGSLAKHISSTLVECSLLDYYRRCCTYIDPKLFPDDGVASLDLMHVQAHKERDGIYKRLADAQIYIIEHGTKEEFDSMTRSFFDSPILFGKYRGQSWEYMIQNGRGYLRWLCENPLPDNPKWRQVVLQRRLVDNPTFFTTPFIK